MGIRRWWKLRREQARLVKQSVSINNDPHAIATFAPELVGKSFVEGGAFILKQIEIFRRTCTEAEQAELARRLKASQDSWAADGLTMPYWGSLVVLRRLQDEIASLASIRNDIPKDADPKER